MTKYMPDGYQEVTPFIIAEDAAVDRVLRQGIRREAPVPDGRARRQGWSR